MKSDIYLHSTMPIITSPLWASSMNTITDTHIFKPSHQMTLFFPPTIIFTMPCSQKCLLPINLLLKYNFPINFCSWILLSVKFYFQQISHLITSIKINYCNFTSKQILLPMNLMQFFSALHLYLHYAISWVLKMLQIVLFMIL